ncbi:MAG: hypothetical protein ACT4OM_03105 [Actinomycetota bacterium]
MIKNQMSMAEIDALVAEQMPARDLQFLDVNVGSVFVPVVDNFVAVPVNVPLEALNGSTFLNNIVALNGISL